MGKKIFESITQELTGEFNIIARTSYALEEVLAKEIEGIGGQRIEILNRAVSFYGTKETLYRANLELRTCLRVLVPIYMFEVYNEVDLYRETKMFDWDKYLDLKTTFAISSDVYSRFFNHENYVALKVKDAIVDQLREVYGGRRPDVDLEDPDLRLHVHLSDNMCTILLDSSGDSLHKRGYRIGQGIAPINEVLAAGMIMLSGWNAESDFVDPMCGSGTILMEAATIAYNIAPGIKIEKFGFMKWKDYEPELWERLKVEAKSRERDFPYKIMGFDDSPKAILVAKNNIKYADLGWKILVRTLRLEKMTREDIPETGFALINPPYGERLEADTDALYKTIGDCLKQNFDGFSVWIISSNKDSLRNIGLRTSKKLTLFNGALECKFHNFEIYKGSRKTKYNKVETEEAE